MGKTPDRTPGVEDQEGTIYERTVLATVPGEVRFDDVAGRFSCFDDGGEFDPRLGGVVSFQLPRLVTANVTVPGDKTLLGHDAEIANGVEILILDGGEVLCI